MSDTQGGCIVAWTKEEQVNQSTPSYTNYISIHRFDANGKLVWQKNNDYLTSTIWTSDLIKDNAGGAYLICKGGQLFQNATQSWGFANRLQHIKSDGTVDRDETYSTINCATEDGKGGLGYVYANENGTFIQHLEASGNKPWGEQGTLIGNKNLIPITITITSDGSGGFIISWLEGHTGRLDDTYSSHVQRISADGNLLWGDNGIRLDQ